MEKWGIETHKRIEISIILLVLLLIPTMGWAGKTKTIWVYGNSSVTPYLVPPASFPDRIFVGNDITGGALSKWLEKYKDWDIIKSGKSGPWYWYTYGEPVISTGKGFYECKDICKDKTGREYYECLRECNPIFGVQESYLKKYVDKEKLNSGETTAPVEIHMPLPPLEFKIHTKDGIIYPDRVSIKVKGPCPWRHKIVPESEATKWEDEGWEPFGMTEREIEVQYYGRHIFGTEIRFFIGLRKKVCDEKTD